MSNMKVLREFIKCPYCGGDKTVSQEGTFEVKKEHIEHTSISASIIPLSNPQLVALSTPALVIFEDICWDCGARRVTRVEGGSIPVKHGLPPQQRRNN